LFDRIVAHMVLMDIRVLDRLLADVVRLRTPAMPARRTGQSAP
jgi:hypothetical protein